MKKRYEMLASKFLRASVNRKKFRTAAIALAVVVFASVYAMLLLPGEALTHKETVLDCHYAVHQHTDKCYDGSDEKKKNPICGYADYVIHTHNDDCYDSKGELLCKLPEVEEHKHNADCWKSREVLICTKEESGGHQHDKACYKEEKGDLECKLEEHAHDDSCKDETGALTCTKEEHQHTDKCYGVNEVLICGMEQGEGSHKHGGDCYETEKYTDCGLYEVHVHDEKKCYDSKEKDADGKPLLTCEKVVMPKHIHTKEEECFTEIEVPNDDEDPDGSGSTDPENPAEPAPEEPAPENPAEPAPEEPAPENPAEPTPEEPADPENPEEPADPTNPEEPNGEPQDPGENGDEDPFEGEPVPDDTVRIHPAKARPFGMMTMALPNVPDNAFNIANYITKDGTSIQYKGPTDFGWVDIGGNTIPGDAALKLIAKFKNLPMDEVRKADGVLIYELPPVFKDLKLEKAEMREGTKVIGHMRTEGNTLVIEMDGEWMDNQRASYVEGFFEVEGQVDVSSMQDSIPGSIVIGNVPIQATFEDDIYAKHAKVDIKKEMTNDNLIIEPDGTAYFEYTLTARAGTDGAQNVWVYDAFTSKNQYMGGYPEINHTNYKETSTVSGAPQGHIFFGKRSESGDKTEATYTEDPNGDLVWRIGDMKPDEVRTLTYRIPVDKNYAGVKRDDTVVNGADVYSKKYKHDGDTSKFTARGNGSVNKSGVKVTPDPDPSNAGGYIAEFRVDVGATQTNTWTLKDVIVEDDLSRTDSHYKEDLDYIESSFKVYSKTKDSNNKEVLTLIPDLPAKLNVDNKAKTVSLEVGDLAPGEMKVVTYSIRMSADAVNKGVYSSEGGSATTGIIAKNQASFSDNRENIPGEENHKITNNATADLSMYATNWLEKAAAKDPLTAEKTVPMSGSIVNPDGTSVSGVDSFVVPAKSYQYVVWLNRNGKYDVSEVTLTDNLSDNGGTHYLEYVGYAEVKDNNTQKTVWVRIDGGQSPYTFSIKPKDIGFDEGAHNLSVTYYARPINLDTTTATYNVSNGVTGVGDIGIEGGETFHLNTTVGASAKVIGEGKFNVSKEDWYFGRGDTADGYDNGTMYWAIKATGLVKDGYLIRDQITGGRDYTGAYSKGELTDCNMNQQDIVGVYKVSFAEGESQSIDEYETLDDFLKRDGLTELEKGTDYTVNKQNKMIDVTFKGDQELSGNQAIFVIVKTEPKKLPETSTDNVMGFNILNYKSDNQWKWTDNSQIPDALIKTQTVYGSDGIAKDFATVVEIKDGMPLDKYYDRFEDLMMLDWEAFSEDGTYLIWDIIFNSNRDRDGEKMVSIFDELPAGLELVRASVSDSNAHLDKGQSGADDDEDGSDPFYHLTTKDGLESTGWKLHQHEFDFRATQGNCVYEDYPNIYYTKGQGIQWVVGEVKGMIKIKVYTRVTDAAKLLQADADGGIDFVNKVFLYNPNGTQVGEDTATATLHKRTVQKTDIRTDNNGIIPYELTLNEAGDDLSPGTDELTLVDEMCQYLTIDPSTIKVTNTETGEKIKGYVVIIDGLTMKISKLPDETPITITYNATVNASDSETVTLTNNAHWEGQEPNQNSSSSISSYNYKGKGGIKGQTGIIDVFKRDKNNAAVLLPGATFTLTEMTNDLQERYVTGKNGVAVKREVTDTTDADGKIVFDKLAYPADLSQTQAGKAEAAVQFNTVYRLVEDKAPNGYISNTEPVYLMLVKGEYDASGVLRVKNDDGSFGDEIVIPAGVQTWFQSGTYLYDAYNEKSYITVNKKFLKSDGSEKPTVNGGTFTFGLYDKKLSSKDDDVEPVQTQSITLVGDPTKDVTSVRFDNLSNGKYYLYEMDEDGKPIMENEIVWLNGLRYLPHVDTDGNLKTAESNEINIDGDTPELNLCNQEVAFTQMPHTGGMGTTAIYSTGALLAVGGALLLMLRRKKA